MTGCGCGSCLESAAIHDPLEAFSSAVLPVIGAVLESWVALLP